MRRHNPLSPRIPVPLTPEEAARLARPIRGEGGLQTLLRRLQTHLADASVDVYLADIPRIERYQGAYGDGGFQGRLPLAALARIGMTPCRKPSKNN